jgi:hypothetical protein
VRGLDRVSIASIGPKARAIAIGFAVRGRGLVIRRLGALADADPVALRKAIAEMLG